MEACVRRIDGGERRSQSRRHHRHLCMRVGQRGPAGEPPDDAQEMIAAALWSELLGGKAERRPRVEALRKLQVVRQHADDEAGMTRNVHRAPYRAGISAETTLPERPAQHDHPSPPGLLLVAREPAPECRLHAQQRQQRAGGTADQDVLRRPRVGEVPAAVPPGCDATHGGEVFVVVAVFRQRHRSMDLAPRGVETHQASGLTVRQRLEQQAAHDAEHARRRADGHRHREDHHRSESRAAQEQPQRAPEILTQLVHEGRASEIRARHFRA